MKKERTPKPVIPLGDDHADRQSQRETLEKLISKGKVKLSTKEKELMNHLLAELDLKELRSDEDTEEAEDERSLAELMTLLKEKKASNGGPSVESPPKDDIEDVTLQAQQTPPPTAPETIPERPSPIQPEPVAIPEPPPEIEEEILSETPEPATEEEKPVDDPELTVRKYIEAWNRKAFGAEYACFSKELQTLNKESYVERRNSTHIKETRLKPVVQRVGIIHSKEFYGDNVEILCERVVRDGPKMSILLENYHLRLEDGAWKIRAVESLPLKSPRKPRRKGPEKE